MSLTFGTDGVRGRANTELSASAALLMGTSAASVLSAPNWIVGRDTRESGSMLEAAFSAGVAATGASIQQLAIVPSAEIAFVCRELGVPGAVVTASHNPYQDNGIKIFGPDGRKLPDETEALIEQEMASPTFAPTGRAGIVAAASAEVSDLYPTWLLSRARGLDLRGKRIGIDCANGASFRIAPRVLAATGAEIVPIGVAPDGLNINLECGSTHLDKLSAAVVSGRLDLGLAFDGDADRMLAIDDRGEPVDGDRVLAIIAQGLADQGRLKGSVVVATEWSNLGLSKSLAAAGIEVVTCDVGDKAVAIALRKHDGSLGGESSGHIIMPDQLPVGDGISTALEFLRVALADGRPVSAIAAASMTQLPQRTANVRVDRPPKQVVESLRGEWQRVAESLGDSGRIVLRASGTERVVRVLVQTETEDAADSVLSTMSDLVLRYGQA